MELQDSPQDKFKVQGLPDGRSLGRSLWPHQSLWQPHQRNKAVEGMGGRYICWKGLGRTLSCNIIIAHGYHSCHGQIHIWMIYHILYAENIIMSNPCRMGLPLQYTTRPCIYNHSYHSCRPELIAQCTTNMCEWDFYIVSHSLCVVSFSSKSQSHFCVQGEMDAIN